MTEVKDETELKITWREFKACCEQAGIKDDDSLDVVHITWGSIDNLECRYDKDFGWQVVLDCDC